MKTLTVAVALAATAFASPAFAVACETNCPITISFTEAANDDSNNPAATVTGTTAYTHLEDGERSRVTLTNYFGEQSTAQNGLAYLYNLLEPGTGAISDQVRLTKDSGNLLIEFISDPALFLKSEPDGSVTESGNLQTVLTYGGNNNGLRPLTIMAASEGEAVPEPATWAMMLLGFGGIGFAMRRRRTSGLAQLA